MTDPRAKFLWPIVRGLAFVMALLGASVACSGPGHPNPPLPSEDVSRVLASQPLAVELPFKKSTASIERLRGLRDEQANFFSEYRVQYDDAFTIAIMGHPEWTTNVTVLRDGNVYFGFLDRSLNVVGKTFDEIKEMIIYGDPPRTPCPNCGYFYDRALDACPACGAVPADVSGTAVVVLSKTASEDVQQLGGVVSPEAQPFRPVAGVGGEHWVVFCTKGIVGLRVDVEKGIADRVWTRDFGRTVLDRKAMQDRLLSSPLAVRVGRRWVLLDLRSGLTSPASTQMADKFVAAELPAPPTPTGLNVFFVEPRVQITNIIEAPNSYTVNVIGAVNAPGRVKVQRGYRLWDAITDAGGPKVANRLTVSTSEEAPTDPTVDWKKAVLMRESRFLPANTLPPEVDPSDLVRLEIDFERLSNGDPEQNIPLFPGDVVYIPEFIGTTTSVTVIGQVGAPGLIYFRGQIDLMSALARAGWIEEETAFYSGIYLVRNSFGDTNTREVYRLNAVALAKGQARNILLQDDDIIYVNTDSLTDITAVMGKIFSIIGSAAIPAATIRSYETLLND